MRDIVFDIETEKSFDEVGGKENFHLLGVTVVGIYDYQTGEFRAYERDEMKELTELLKKADRLIGFNSNHFDLPVLAPYVDMNLYSIPHLDLMADVEIGAGFRIGLGNLATVSLGAAKSGSGLDAIRWWREGEKQKVKDYCLQDVKVTRDLFEYGKHHGKIFFEERKTGRRKEIPVTWGEKFMDIESTIRQGFEKRMAVRIEYRVKTGFKETREETTVDVEEIRSDSIATFCHELKVKKVFQSNDITAATLTETPYRLAEDVQQTLI